MSAHASRGRAQFLRRDVWTERATNRPDSLDQKPAGGLDGASTSSLSPFHHSAIQIHPAIERTQQGAAATRARELERSRARTLRRFYQFQYELYQHSTPFMQLFHSLLRTVMDRKEFCDTLGPVLAFVKIHARLLEQLPELTQYPFGKSKFHDVVHQAFVKVSGFFRKYINNFDRMYQMLTNWKATNAAFCEMLQKGERACKSTSSLGKLDFASLLALPLTCLQVHQEILQQYRLVQEDADDDLERARIDRVLVIISAMCQYADFHGAAGQSVKTLLSIEKKMVQLAAHSSIVGAVVSIVKLGRRTVHIDRLRMLGGSRDEKGEHAIDCTGYLFSDILVCCHGYKGGLVAKCIIDLKKAEIEGCQRYHDPKAPYCLDHTRHNFCIHQLEFNRPHDQKYFGTSDSENLNVWMAKLKDCLSSLAAAGLRSMPLGAEEIGAMSHMRKQAIQCNLFASGASDATTEEGTWTTSESDKDEWYIEEYASGYSSQTHEESSQGASGMMTSLGISCIKGLTADMPDFREVLQKKLSLLISKQHRHAEMSFLDEVSGNKSWDYERVQEGERYNKWIEV